MMAVELLAPGQARLWFEALSHERPERDWVDDIERVLEGGPLRPHLRAIVEEGGAPFGRMAAQVKENVIAFWNPSFRPGTSPDKMRIAMRLLIRKLADTRRIAGLGALLLESRPGDDIPDNALWLDALADEGFVRLCAYGVHVLRLDRPIRFDTPAHAVSVREAGIIGDAGLASLYRRAKSDTLERRGVDLERAEAVIEDRKQMAAGYDPQTWLVAYLDGEPAAYALANMAREEEFGGSCAWLVDIACVPAHRRKGLAAALLAEIVKRLRATGAKGLLASIEEENVPSIRLHAALGFEPQKDRHYIYQRK
jgi:L-amino acid N-acyltransferase YncA